MRSPLFEEEIVLRETLDRSANPMGDLFAHYEQGDRVVKDALVAALLGRVVAAHHVRVHRLRGSPS